MLGGLLGNQSKIHQIGANLQIEEVCWFNSLNFVCEYLKIIICGVLLNKIPVEVKPDFSSLLAVLRIQNWVLTRVKTAVV